MWKDLSAGVVILALGFFAVRAQTDTGFQNNVTARVSAAKNSEKGDAAKRDLKIRSRDAKAYYDLGVKHGLAKRYEEAAEAFKQAIRLKPDYSDAYFGLGHAYSDLGRWEEAVEAYERVVHLNPKDKEAYARLGEAYVKLRARAGGATRSVNRANASENESSEVNRTLMRPPASKAAPTFRMDSTTAAKSAPSNEVKTHYVRGLEHYRLGRYKEAVESYKQVIQLDADHPAAHYHLGMAYFKLGQDREAIRAFQQAILVSPENHAPSLKLGTLYGYYGLHKEAIEPLRRAIRLQPYSAEAHNNLGAAYYRTGQYREALEAFKQAVRLAPQVAIAHLNLSDAYQKLGLLKESAEAKRQADLLNSQGVKLLSAVWLTTLEPQSASGTSAGAGNHHDGSKAVEKEVKTVKDSSDKPEGRERESVKDGANERVETKESEAVRAANA
ncbi:MAG TPA: tetratricopeptide repeat protein, partial [Pyrinomonadaceae bacterium]|nr:tetratricopeptide repeat protein [Pyrinomonadaceae bacterium]